jgi:hypothetical protein
MHVFVVKIFIVCNFLTDFCMTSKSNPLYRADISKPGQLNAVSLKHGKTTTPAPQIPTKLGKKK